MSRLCVAPIVEGHGEARSAIRTVVTRVWTELLGAEYVEVLQPVRQPRARLLDSKHLMRAVDLAALKLHEKASTDRAMILVLLDADEDAPCILGPRLVQAIQENRPHLDVAVVLANVEFETWFAAAAESLTDFFDLSVVAPALLPEVARQRKGTVTRWLGGDYAETVDQVRLTQAMDLKMCRARSPSFDKLCRELERRL